MITISHIAMTASSFLMVAASFERYCVTAQPGLAKVCFKSSCKNYYFQFLNRNRFKIAAGSCVLGILTKITHGFEFSVRISANFMHDGGIFQVTTNEDCIGTMGEYILELSELALNKTYMAFWKIWWVSISAFTN